MITADQIVIHVIGDYVLQSDWMANEKTKQHFAAFCHAMVYSVLFLPLCWRWSPWYSFDHGFTSERSFPDILPWLVIFATHFLIDRYRLARYVVWAKNFIAPSGTNKPWAECVGTGYPADRPAWLAVWLLIFADNIIHIVINGLALRYL